MKISNIEKLTIGITIVNLLSWGLIELWSYRYANSNIAVGTAIFIAIQLIIYYVVLISSVTPKEKQIEKITPQNCNSHDWQKSKYNSPNYKSETCVRCGAERGV